MGTALAFAMQLLSSLPSLIEAGVKVGSLISDGNAKLKAFADEKRDPTPEEWTDLGNRIDALRKELHA